MRGGITESRCKLNGGRAIERVEHLRLHLLQSLMSQNQADIELASLVENDRNFGVALDEILAFVDVDKTGEALVLRKELSFVRGQQNHRYEETSHNLHALLLKETLRDVDKDNFGRSHFGEEIGIAFISVAGIPIDSAESVSPRMNAAK